MEKQWFAIVEILYNGKWELGEVRPVLPIGATGETNLKKYPLGGNNYFPVDHDIRVQSACGVNWSGPWQK